HS
ncbi:lipoprotein bor, partial [Escherichia coli 88.0221]